MHGLRSETVESLRARIAALEKRPALAGDGLPAASAEPAFGPLDLLAGSAGLLHEIFLDDRRGAGAGFGFSLGLARPLLTPTRQALIYLQLTSQTQEIGFPYAPGFEQLGIDPENLVLCRVDTLTELLWATEEAIGCRAVAAVIADVPGHEKDLDFTVSRRLSLRTAGGASAFLLRYGAGRESSAAKLRWRIAPTPSLADLFDPNAPGPPRYAVTIEKCRLGARAQKLEGRSFDLDWVENVFVIAKQARTGRAFAPRRTTASGAEPALVGHRLSEAG